MQLPETRGDRAAVLGISFGGVYARWLAKTRPEIVGLVTYLRWRLGSAGRIRATRPRPG